MKIIACLLIFAGVMFAQAPLSAGGPLNVDPDGTPSRKLMSIVYSVEEDKLCWNVMSSRMEGGVVIEKLEDQPCIDPKKATMEIAGDVREFSQEEARGLRKLLAILTLYALESQVWFDEGHGKPSDGKEKVLRRAIMQDRELAHGPSIPPDPWELAHGPSIPPDPWERCAR